jgi:Nucleotidyltransferase domain.
MNMKTERLVLRPVEQGDAEAIHVYAGDKIEYICSEFVKSAQAILKDNLKGIYLHGSSVMGCFNPAKSDIDLIVVTEDEMSDDTKREFIDMVMELNTHGPKKGIEMSVVRKKDCDPFIYPTPFDLHFSVAQIKWYTEAPEDYISKMKGTDADLAAHFTIIRKRGKCLYGLPIEQVFGEVPKADYFDSIWNDIAEAKDDIKDNPMYIILNLARVLAYKKEELVLSKKEGGQWGLNNLPKEFHPLITAALKEYEDGTDSDYDMKCAADYAEFMLKEIYQEEV